MKPSGFLTKASKLSKTGTRQLLAPALFTIAAFATMGGHSVSAETIIHDNLTVQASIQQVNSHYSYHVSP